MSEELNRNIKLEIQGTAAGTNTAEPAYLILEPGISFSDFISPTSIIKILAHTKSLLSSSEYTSKLILLMHISLANATTHIFQGQVKTKMPNCQHTPANLKSG